MKKIVSLVLLFVLLLCGCENAVSTKKKSSGNSSNKDNSLNQQSNISSNKDDGYMVMYNDEAVIEDENIKIEFGNASSSGESGDVSLRFYIKITNKTIQTKDFEIKRYTVIKENTSVKYELNCQYESFNIAAEMNKEISMNGKIPSRITDDKYYVEISINTYNIRLYLYETPDELREDRTVNYCVNDNIVNTITVKDRRKLDTNYVYVTADRQYYYGTWYSDPQYKNVVNSNSIINGDMNLYSRQNTVIKCITTSSDIYTFVNGFNYIPSDGIIVIPDKLLNKKIALSVGAISDAHIRAIYISKGVSLIYSYNFNIPGLIVYYEGTEEEWRSAFYAQNDVVIDNVVFNTKYNE